VQNLNLNRIIPKFGRSSAEVRPNVEAWPNRTEPKLSAKYSADVRPKPNFGASLPASCQFLTDREDLLTVCCEAGVVLNDKEVTEHIRRCWTGIIT